jgi:uroporphyrinogen-III synthase
MVVRAGVRWSSSVVTPPKQEPRYDLSVNGARVALLEGRMGRELASLIRRHGGEPVSVPAVREVPLSCSNDVAKLLDALRDGDIQFVILLTGVAVNALFQEAESLGRSQELGIELRKVATVCRGPKPAAALKVRGIAPSMNIVSPFTSSELLTKLAEVELAGKGVALLHYGERALDVAQALRNRGAKLRELCLYEWALPEDIEPLRMMVADIIDGRFAAVAFTSKAQVHHLFRVAALEVGGAERLAEAMKTRVVVATVGPTCSAAVIGFGVVPHVMPTQPKMGPMVGALAQYLTRS